MQTIRMLTLLLVMGLAFALATPSHAVTVLGTGTGALLGGDITDPEDDGNGANYDPPGNLDGYNAIFSASSEANFDPPNNEGAFNVFDNTVGSGQAKWCCDGPTQWVQAQFKKRFVLTHFTITSGNDTPGRRPDVWQIQGSIDGVNWSTIFSYDNDGGSGDQQVDNSSPFTANNQVLLYSDIAVAGNPGGDFSTPTPFSYFRYEVTSSAINVGGGGVHQLNELEFFGRAIPEPASAALALMGLGAVGMSMRRRQA